MMLTVRANGSYSTELYMKPMTAPIIMHFRSAHSIGTKKGILKSQIKRAVKLSSDIEARKRRRITIGPADYQINGKGQKLAHA